MKRYQRYRQRHREQGLCELCRAPHAENRTLCQRHLEQRRRRHRRRVANRVAQGLCRDCAEPALRRALCATHLEQQNDRAARARPWATKYAAHNRACGAVLRHLRRLGVDASRNRDWQSGVDVVTASGVTVGVRVSTRVAQHRHYNGSDGQRRVYLYHGWLWNIHIRGRRVRQPDVWVLVKAGRFADTLVVPARELCGKTPSLPDTPRHKRRSRLYRYVGAWSHVVGVVEAVRLAA